jgi:hypothetical protein
MAATNTLTFTGGAEAVAGTAVEVEVEVEVEAQPAASSAVAGSRSQRVRKDEGREDMEKLDEGKNRRPAFAASYRP